MPASTITTLLSSGVPRGRGLGVFKPPPPPKKKIPKPPQKLPKTPPLLKNLKKNKI